MTNIIDFHTHCTDAKDALISVDPRQFAPQPSKWYSVGFHPWQDIDKLTQEDFILLEQCAQHPQVLAIGETGMDSLRGASLDIQAPVFVKHLQLADKLGKPVVVHSVRTAQNILAERRKAGLSHVTLAIHGMRANERVARTLLDEGCYLSFGPKFNPKALLATPTDRLLIETDDSGLHIEDVADQIASVMGMSPDELIHLASANAHHLLSLNDSSDQNV